MPDINTEKVCYVIAKARELEGEDNGMEADASNATDDNFHSMLTDDAYNSIRAELKAYVDAMDEDEQCELVALTWVGRGDYTAEEWKAAVAEARRRRDAPTSTYLLDNPLLASHLDYGLAEFGESCEGFAADRQ
ncbi:MAG TPA: DUF3775 domain-containing protein [Roseiarcus sp.]|jgi:hypothetical protein